MDGQKIDFTTEYAERISKNEARLGEVEKKTNDLSQIKETLIILTTIQKDMIEDNKVRDKERKESAKAMSELSLSVKQTTEAVSKLNTKLDSTDKKLDGFVNDKNAQTEDRKSKRIFWSAIIGSLFASVSAIATAIIALSQH